MANKKVSEPKKKKSGSAAASAAKAPSKKGASRDSRADSAKASRGSEPRGSTTPAAPRPRRGIGCKILPYFLILFALVLTVCLIIVHALDIDDGAGAVGYAIQWFFGGLLGGGNLFLPLVLAYIGIKWCVYNIKWVEADMLPSSPVFTEYRKAKSRMILQGVMSCLSLLTVSVIFGVFADYPSVDLEGMWTDGAEDLFMGGGILGSILGYLMVTAFEQVISLIILFILLILFVLLMLGLTPDYIVRRIQESRERRREERAYLAEQRFAEEQERRKEEQQHAHRMAAAAAVPAPAVKQEKPSRGKRAQELSAEEIMEMGTDTPAEPEPEIYIGPARDEASSERKSEETGNDSPEGQDYDANRDLEGTEYDKLEEFFKTLNSQSAEASAKEMKREGTPKKAEAPAEPLDLSEIGTEELLSDMAAVTPEEGGEAEEEAQTPYVFPPIDMLEKNKNKAETDYTAELQENAHRLLDTLKSFKVNIREINYSRGPTITRYELKPEAGTRVRSIANLVDDISLSLATSGVRIEAPIPGKPAVGIEVPNRNRATVYLRDLIDNSQFTEAKSKLTSCLGMDVGGNPIYFDIAKMPHLLIAGATGMGKSVCINSVIISILYKAKPEDVKLILIDPKKVEFNIYKDIPHLYAPIVSDPKKAAGALASAVAEMERRFELIEEVGVRDITTYNAVTENDPYKEHMPQMVIIIDELADLMMTAPDEVETAICRLAQKARAAGIHIIIGTQRPSVDVITGLIKANIPSRIACTVASQVDSRTIIDIAGAEKLIGRGDMLFAPVGAAKPLRVQGAFVTETEVENIATFIRENNAKAKYNSEFINRIEEEAAKCGMGKKGAAGGDALPGSDVEGGDSKFREAVKLAVEEGKISTSLMQRRLGLGYGRAAKIIDTMEQMGYVSKPDGNKPRRVLLSAEEYARRVTEGTLGDSDD
ncbi:MAG: DNA translocase FtsK [Clostridia bacterium]|nr:DNA translocase FtsK [Clostridia bacterium]